jgi:hypothetical protein
MYLPLFLVARNSCPSSGNKWRSWVSGELIWNIKKRRANMEIKKTATAYPNQALLYFPEVHTYISCISYSEFLLISNKYLLHKFSNRNYTTNQFSISCQYAVGNNIVAQIHNIHVVITLNITLFTSLYVLYLHI